MNLKIERYNHTFVKEISAILQNEVKDEMIHFVTITGCKITNDLSYAKVYYTVLDNTKKKETQEALERASSFIRGKLSSRIEIRHTPELIFVFDSSIEYGNKIEGIIDLIHKKEEK